MRPRLLVTTCFAVALAAISGCGGASSTGAGGGSAAKSGVEPVGAPGCGKLEFGGQGKPDALIVSDLPLQGDSSERSKQQVEAIRLVLGSIGWRSGQLSIALQSCDDSIAKTGLWDEDRCKQNATAYAENPDLLGVIGTYNSGCAEIEIPILNEADGGGLAMVSPGNTLVCLTQPSDDCNNGEPDSLYPSGTRNYARVVPNDAVQGAGLATFAKDEGAKKVFVLSAAGDPTSRGQANTFTNAAGALGLDIVGSDTWNPEAKSYTDLFKTVGKADPQGVLLAGLTEQNGGQLIKDKVSVLGPNDGAVKLFAPDGFAQQSTIDLAGPASAGMFVSVPGRDPQTLIGVGAEFVNTLQAEIGNNPVELYAPYSGEAATILLQAIQRGQAARNEVIRWLFQTNVQHGITGSFNITASGDPSRGPITVFVGGKTFTQKAVVVPPGSLAAAARGKSSG